MTCRSVLSQLFAGATALSLVIVPANVLASTQAEQSGTTENIKAAENHIRTTGRAQARVVHPVRVSATHNSVKVADNLTYTRRTDGSGTVVIDLQ